MKLTPTMLAGLQKMAQNLKRQSATMGEPNDGTGKALERRGLVERVEHNSSGWNYYVLTAAGRSALSKEPEA